MKNVIGSLKAFRRELQYYIKFGAKIKRIHKEGAKLYVCVGTAVHGNMGDQALGYTRQKFLEKIDISNMVEYTSRDRMRYWPQICRTHKTTDVFVLRGGGCWGDLWIDGFEEMLLYIKQFFKNPIVVFPQSVYFSNTEYGRKLLEKSKTIIDNNPQLIICARDLYSETLLKTNYPNTKILVMPDTVLSFKPQITNSTKREGVLLCLRKDKEKKLSSDMEKQIENIIKKSKIKFQFQDTSIDFNLKKISQRETQLYMLWRKFAMSKVVITDRVHGMIFAAITGTPCVVFDNIDGKVGHQYHWLKELGYIFFITDASKSQFETVYNNALRMKGQEYPVDVMWPYFDELKNCLLDI